MKPNDSAHDLYLRRIRSSDIDLMFYWVNSPDSLRHKKKTQAPVKWSAHQQWFNDRLSDSDTRIWVIEKNHKPIGQVRVQLENGVLSIDIFIDPSQRCKGYGYKAIKMLIKQCHMIWPGVSVLAEVRNENYPSLSFFIRLGFQISADDEHVSQLVYKTSTIVTEKK